MATESARGRRFRARSSRPQPIVAATGARQRYRVRAVTAGGRRPPLQPSALWRTADPRAGRGSPPSRRPRLCVSQSCVCLTIHRSSRRGGRADSSGAAVARAEAPPPLGRLPCWHARSSASDSFLGVACSVTGSAGARFRDGSWRGRAWWWRRGEASRRLRLVAGAGDGWAPRALVFPVDLTDNGFLGHRAIAGDVIKLCAARGAGGAPRRGLAASSRSGTAVTGETGGAAADATGRGAAGEGAGPCAAAGAAFSASSPITESSFAAVCSIFSGLRNILLASKKTASAPMVARVGSAQRRRSHSPIEIRGGGTAGRTGFSAAGRAVARAAAWAVAARRMVSRARAGGDCSSAPAPWRACAGNRPARPDSGRSPRRAPRRQRGRRPQAPRTEGPSCALARRRTGSASPLS